MKTTLNNTGHYKWGMLYQCLLLNNPKGIGIMPIEKPFPSLPRFIVDFYRDCGFRIGIISPSTGYDCVNI